jgi:hypothetical protein
MYISGVLSLLSRMQKVGDIIDFINNLGFATSILLPLQQLSVPFDSQAAVVKISPPQQIIHT